MYLASISSYIDNIYIRYEKRMIIFAHKSERGLETINIV